MLGHRGGFGVVVRHGVIVLVADESAMLPPLTCGDAQPGNSRTAPAKRRRKMSAVALCVPTSRPYVSRVSTGLPHALARHPARGAASEGAPWVSTVAGGSSDLATAL
jgi:hypothetical protein